MKDMDSEALRGIFEELLVARQERDEARLRVEETGRNPTYRRRDFKNLEELAAFEVDMAAERERVGEAVGVLDAAERRLVAAKEAVKGVLLNGCSLEYEARDGETYLIRHVAKTRRGSSPTSQLYVYRKKPADWPVDPRHPDYMVEPAL